MATLAETSDGNPILLGLPALIAIPPSVVILAGFMLVGTELCFQQQAPLALPFARRDLLRARRVYIALLFGLCTIAIAAFVMIESAVHASMPGWTDKRWFRPGWTSYLNGMMIAAMPPTIAGLAFIGRSRMGNFFLNVYVSVFFLGAVFGLILSILSMAQPWWPWISLAGLWAVIVPLLPKRTLTEDAMV